MRDTRAALIDAAIATLRESGFAAASARRIAAEAGCNQALIFYHFGSVPDLLMAALEEVSARRMAAYRELLDRTGTLGELIDAARTVFEADLDSGNVTVLAEMISGSHSVPGLGERVSACLAPWRSFAETAVRDVLASSPFGSLAPPGEIAHGVVAGLLGLEMLASLDGDRASALALFDRARARRRRARPDPAAGGPAQPVTRCPPGSARSPDSARSTGGIMQIDVVTGAFGYSGAAIARELLAAGHQVRTLTGHPGRAPAGSQIDARPLDFADADGLERDLRGAHTLYNTYWVRFPHGGETHATAVANSRVLFAAAARAGIQRIVHVSITHADPASPYPYFSGKAAVEAYLRDLGVPYAIARPSILFGGDGVLLNNIAWLLRRLPVFAVGGRGDYHVRPIHVDDLARLCLQLGGRPDSVTVDAVGPDSPTFRDMVLAIRAAVGSRALIVPAPGWAIPPLSAVLGAALHDVLLTREEYRAMADGLADSDAPSTGSTSLTEWIAGHGHELGRSYANELTRHYR